MTNARTLPRHVGALGAIACLLAPVSSLAAVNPDGLYVMSSSSTGVKTGQYIEAAATARYQPYFGASKLYTKAMVPVATSTLRRGGVAALRAGVVHPGFQIALMAAGYLLMDNNEIGAPPADAELKQELDSFLNDYPDQASPLRYTNSDCSGSFGNTVSLDNAIDQLNIPQYSVTSILYNRTHETQLHWPCVVLDRDQSSTVSYLFRTGSSYYYDGSLDTTSEPEPLPEEDYELIDPHIPPQLYDELWNGGPIPEWRDEITVLGEPESLVQPTGDQAVAPEVATKIGAWAENAQAMLDGEPLPNPDEDTSASTAEDQMLEDMGLDGPVPPFPDAEPEWQVETIDNLPEYDMGLGSGVCPAPNLIEVPMYGTLELNWQPACDLAGWLRGAVIAVCMILSLYIVLGTRATTA